MIVSKTLSGSRRTLTKRLQKLLAAVAVSVLVSVAGLGPVTAGGETRTISLYHVHTGESLTITYKKDGHYIPSAMRQINYLMRDWRKNQVINIDPRTIDLVWELHEDLGSHEPVHIVCGYRSASTNAFLHRIGRHVARESQHIQGKAIDFYFPDVPTKKIRNIALVREVGGVGYYRSSGGPTGFMHVDSGHVRHWGPAISSSEMAQIFHDGEKVLGRRLRSPESQTEVASADDGEAKPGFLSRLLGLDKTKHVALANRTANTATAAPDDAAIADLSADAAATPNPKLPDSSKLTQTQMASLGDLSEDAATPARAPRTKLPARVSAVDAETYTPDENATVTKNRNIPKPRLKPVEVLLLAAANMKTPPQLIRINAASAPPPDQSGRAVGPTGQGLGVMMEAAALDPSASGKGGLGSELRNGTAKGLPVIRQMIASAADSDINWWPAEVLRTPEEAIRRDGQPTLIGTLDQDVLPKAAILDARASGGAYAATVAEEQRPADGKGDLLNEN